MARFCTQCGRRLEDGEVCNCTSQGADNGAQTAGQDSFQNQGEALVKYGAAVLFALLFALAGLVLGILSRMVQDRFYFFSYVGMTLNGLALLSIGFILYAGVYGL